jgi:hypothetical protein
MAKAPSHAPEADCRKVWCVELIVHVRRAAPLTNHRCVVAPNARAAARDAVAQEAAANAWPGERLERCEITNVRRYVTLRRCRMCHRFRGDPESTIFCLCFGPPCQRCAARRHWRPVSECYDEATNTIWHVPHFLFRPVCEKCRRGRLLHRRRSRRATRS